MIIGVIVSMRFLSKYCFITFLKRGNQHQLFLKNISSDLFLLQVKSFSSLVAATVVIHSKLLKCLCIPMTCFCIIKVLHNNLFHSSCLCIISRQYFATLSYYTVNVTAWHTLCCIYDKTHTYGKPFWLF